MDYRAQQLSGAVGITINGTRLDVGAGVWWDDVVKTAIDHQLWGLELMSEIP